MPMKVCAKPEPGIVTNGQLKPVAMRLREHRLAGARRAEEEQAALALAAGVLELLARLPQADDARDLALGLGLAAHVVELDAPVGVAGLVALDLLDAEEQQRAEEDQEVDQEEQRQRSARTGPSAAGRTLWAASHIQLSVPSGVTGSPRRKSSTTKMPDDDHGEVRRGASGASRTTRACGRRRPLQQALLGAEEVRPRDHAARQHVDEAAEGRDAPGS